ncbi:MAG: hypothetical protein HY905_21200 [Deltaproteobacteria bacterium]|nr:hypothetical protein [Deltaproteobacteria bacterium]
MSDVRIALSPPRSRNQAPLLAIAALAVAAGCGLIGFGDDAAAVNQCSDDSACGRNAICDQALHVCVARDRPDAGVFLRLTYPSSTGVTLREFQSQRLDSDETVVIDCPAPVEIRGTVQVGESGPTIPADITFLRPSVIPGEPSETSKVSASSSPAAGTDWTYSANLVAWDAERAPYSIYVEPTGSDGAAYPPLFRPLTEPELQQIRESGPGEPSGRIPLVLPIAEDLRRVQGLIVRGHDPVPNVAVRAVDPETGRRISTISTTAPFTTLAGGDPPEHPAGTFELYLPPSVGRFRLEILPTADQPNLPTVAWEGVNFDALDANDDGALVFEDVADNPAADLPPIALPAIGLPVRLEGRVEGTEAGGSAGPVAGATLRFARSIPTGTPGVTATFERTATTDGSGNVIPASGSTDGTTGIALIEGDYVVTVAPPERLPLAGLHLDFFRVAATDPTGDPVQRGQVFQLGPSATLHGSVMDLVRGPAASLPIEVTLAEAGGAALGADPTNLNRSVTGYTESDGTFDLYVENGTHFVAVRPPDESQFPWRIVSNVHVPNGPLDISLEAPVVLSGTVSIGAAPTAGVTVEALVRDSQFGTILEVGETETVEGGEFRLLLSPSLGTL